eukprot:CAMPEP_0174255376 /NCGR_PEP_ID=MMETSP0439-20130205/4709_1 /TAXON_ID=0 /ORGANISM="Stereomyxa ramosa, Strain Chinc5" /LENGTH=1933 /DNA_ID=CAMNT_0015337525 /DNA_START=82 /DNA_END=5880 /DNA_ORIENTATION=+
MDLQGSADALCGGWSGWLPSYCRDTPQEAKTFVSETLHGLHLSLQLKDINRGAKFWIKSLDKLLENYSRNITSEQYIAFKDLLFTLIQMTDLDTGLAAKFLKTTAKLLRKMKKRNVAVEVPWRIFYDRIKAQHFSEEVQSKSMYQGKPTSQFHLFAIRHTVLKARKFFTAESIEEIEEELKDLWCPLDNSVFLTQGLYCLFVSTAPSIDVYLYSPIISSIFKKWQWIDNSIWDCQWLSLIARISKLTYKSSATDVWTSYLPQLFSHFLRIFGLSLGSSKIPKAGKRRSPDEAHIFLGHNHKQQRFRHIAKIIVNLLSAKDALCFDMFSEFFRTLQPYYYPSNRGGWVSSLSTFLQYLCKFYCKRAFKEPENENSEARLGKEDHLKFVTIVKPAVKHALFSKDSSMSSAAKVAYNYLSYLLPREILPSLISSFTSALDTLVATHQTSAAIGTLSYISHPLVKWEHYRSGAKLLVTILKQTLPGIDANDTSKTLDTLNFYSSLLYSLPLIDCSSTFIKSTKKNQRRIAAKELTSYFGEWSGELLDKVFSFLRHLDKPTEDKEQTTNWRAKNFGFILQTTFRVFFMQHSNNLFATMLRKLVSFVRLNIISNATKEVSIICSAACYAHPTETINTLVPIIYKKLVKLDSTTAEITEKLKERSDSEFEWYILILSGLVKFAGAALVTQKDRIMAIIKLITNHEDKKIAQLGCKLLKNVLYGLSSFYPKDYRSHSEATWGTEDFQTMTWKYWGKRTSKDTPDIVWHEPGKLEIETCVEIISQTMKEINSVMTSFLQNPEAITPEELFKCFHKMKHLLSGASAIIPFFPKEAEKNQNKKDIGRAPIGTLPPYITSTHDKEILGDFGDLRIHLLASLHKIHEVFVEKDSENGTSSKWLDQSPVCSLMIEVYDTILNHNGVHVESLHLHYHMLRALKAKYKDPVTGFHPRRYQMYRAHVQHLGRMHSNLWNLDYNQSVKTAVNDLLSLSEHRYLETQQKAIKTLKSAMRHIPPIKNMILGDLLNNFKDPEREEHQLTATISLLFDKSILRHISSNWRWMSSFMNTIPMGFIHNKEEMIKVQQDIYQLFIGFCVSFYGPPLRCGEVPDIPSSPLLFNFTVSEEIKSAAVREIDFSNSKNLENYQLAVEGLLGIASDESLHWRYQIILLTFMLFLIRKDVEIPIELVSKILEGTLNDIPVIRNLSRRALLHILKRENLKIFPDMSSHNNKSGWRERTQTVDDSVSPQKGSEQSQVISQLLGDWFGKNMEQFMNYVVQDHNVEDATMLDKLDHSMLTKLGLTSLDKFLHVRSSAGIGTLLMQQQSSQLITSLLLYNDNNKQDNQPQTVWPNTPFGVHKSSELVSNTLLFKNLFVLLSNSGQDGCDGFQIFELLKPFVHGYLCSLKNVSVGVGDSDDKEVLLAGEAERRTSTYMEVFAAMVQGSRYFSTKLREEMWDYWENSFELLTEVISLESLSVALQGLRFAVHDMRVSEVSKITDKIKNNITQLFKDKATLVESVSAISSMSSLKQSKSLSWLKCLFSELTWRGEADMFWFMSHLETNDSSGNMGMDIEGKAQMVGHDSNEGDGQDFKVVFGHPYKQVRSEISSLLKIVLVSLSYFVDSPTYLTLPSTHPALLSLFERLSASVLPVDGSEPMETTTTGKGKERATETEKACGDEDLKEKEKEVSRFRETLLLFVSSCCHSGFSNCLAPYFPCLLGNVFLMHRDRDRETSGLAKKVSALVAQVIHLDPTTLSAVVDTLLSLPSNPHITWHSRAAVLPFIQIFMYNHKFLLSEQQRASMEKLVVSLLYDDRIEVRELASLALQSLVSTADAVKINTLKDSFFEVLVASKQNGMKEDQAHGAGLGVQAIVLSHPYDLPDWMPALLEEFSVYHSSKFKLLSKAVKTTFVTFWQTHNDTWEEEYEKHFTEDQLQVVVALRSASNYSF